MPSFAYPTLLWGLLLAGVPLLIHLINMLRHRRVDWAAMEFLLASQEKHRTWILLKQLLLLLMRMAVIAVLVLTIAQPVLRGGLGAALGGAPTHHIVLLDDSFSMSDRWDDTSAMAEAARVIQRIGARAVEQSEPQRFTLLRFSQAAVDHHDSRPDMTGQPVDRDFGNRLSRTLAGLDASQTAAGPLGAIRRAEQLLDESDGNRVVYLVSDFRARQWDRADELRTALAALADRGVALRLIDCVDRMRPNLTIRDLSPTGGTRAAGVPLAMEVTIENFGPEPANNITVLLEEDGHTRPGLLIDSIGPRSTRRERFLVRFPVAGQHQIAARLPSDAVAADNVRHAVVDFPVDVPVLVVDGAPEARDARYLSAALAPGGPAQTGIRPRIETPRHLSLQPLGSYETIYLANVDRLDASAVAALEQYVREGGGLAVFLGPRSSVATAEQLYRDGEGLFPMPIGPLTEFRVDRVESAPDVEVDNHPIFRIFSGQKNSFLAAVNVDRYFSVPENWQPEPASGTAVIAWLRGGAPLAVERRLGEGRVIAFTTTASPTWNNWAANNPSFVVVVQQMQAYLGRRATEVLPHLVGEPLSIRLSPKKHLSSVEFAPPKGTADAAAVVDAVPELDGTLVASYAETGAAGVYEARLGGGDGAVERRCFAVNVDSAEGDLARLDGDALASRLQGVAYDYVWAAGFEAEDRSVGGYPLADVLFIVLVVMLLGEQTLALSCSYHPPRRRHSAGGGLP